MAPKAKIYIYARQGVSAAQLLADAQQRFSIQLEGGSSSQPIIEVVPLVNSQLLAPERYPRFTLVGQSWGAARLGRQALLLLRPRVFIDTTGWAATYPLARLAGCRVVAYTHYPTISTDMIRKVWARTQDFNNDPRVAGSALRSLAKLVYYNAFALAYGAAGAFAQLVMVNSSWTQRHVAALFWSWTPPTRVYPPCDTLRLQQLPLDRRLKQLYVVSVAQFRPEKDHQKQLRAFAAAKARAGDGNLKNAGVLRGARLKLVGSCRGPADEARLAELQALAQQLGVAGSVDWCVNVPFSELVELLGDAVAGLHTMRNEHFGISVVEYMAAGAVPIAHKSGGPLEDIVVAHEELDTGQLQPTGFLADSVQEYADALVEVLTMDQRSRLDIATAARRQAAAFSNERFVQDFQLAMEAVLPPSCLSR